MRKGEASPATLEAPGRGGAGGPMFRPAARMMVIGGQPMLQVVLQDVTVDARRRQRAQAYAADVLGAQEDERRRIAQELHDGPLQTLVHICRLIDAVAAGGVANRADGRDPGDRLPTLAQLRLATEAVMAEVRQISRGLRPPLLDDLGLLAALERLADDVERRAGVAASLRVTGDIPRLSPAVELTVYRIAQEALSNVDRHAGASSVDVMLSVAGGWLQLRVADDGEGFDPRAEEGVGSPSLGLPGMAERAELVGGSLHVRSSAGYGTTVALAVPVGEAPGKADVPATAQPASVPAGEDPVPAAGPAVEGTGAAAQAALRYRQTAMGATTTRIPTDQASAAQTLAMDHRDEVPPSIS